ncbi:uncharacterized protein MONBRDRAFT_23906 [Monosiga brevicollis MX1]|uniref:procollagen-proline 4-dioxygenase n=1 Tax=Monosiga brevicollis TaxID=81824 RepID=A9UV67_MONBE|nr:uncharacterized protein MONBRDRAFT_23906 [Monosiga brevicollis MX1]EDQ91028.1 predicted protein [Monosiga brevicollis MX1]|eukprot:XP_001744325.1 hypothetical protein [Monosiga brevicollis MX1]
MLYHALLLACCLAALTLPSGGMGAGDLFTSSANIYQLYSVEKNLASDLETLINDHQVKLDHLRLVVQQLRDAPQPADDLHLSPKESFSVIERLVADRVHNLTSHDMIPSDEDLAGASAALLRLQRTYEMGPDSLMPNASVSAYHRIGRQAYKQGDYASAIDWLAQAADLTQSAKERAEILDYLAFSHFQVGDLQAALDRSAQLLELQPDNGRVFKNVEYYTHQLHKASNGTSASGSVRVARKANYRPDNVLGRDERELLKFNKLCQGRKIYKPSKPLSCRLQHFNKPHLFLKPIRVEYVHEGNNRLQIFRNFASAQECAHLREEGRKKLSRAVAWTDGAFRPVEFRISTAAWLQPDHDDVVTNLHTRIADATQLDLEFAEALQVSNYGIGGFYETHYDHHASRERELPEGDRIATFMIYLNQVEQGGYTAFPRLGAAVEPGHGDAVFWYNLLPDGESDNNTLHGACPVLQGSKWVANKWIHEKKNDICRPLA